MKTLRKPTGRVLVNFRRTNPLQMTQPCLFSLKFTVHHDYLIFRINSNIDRMVAYNYIKFLRYFIHCIHWLMYLCFIFHLHTQRSWGLVFHAEHFSLYRIRVIPTKYLHMVFELPNRNRYH